MAGLAVEGGIALLRRWSANSESEASRGSCPKGVHKMAKKGPPRAHESQKHEPKPRGAGEPRPPEEPARPGWDRASRELRLGQKVIKQVARQAHSQARVLDAFERSGWLTAIANPLGETGEKAISRLREIASRLCFCQTERGIVFYVSGNCIRWRKVSRS